MNMSIYLHPYIVDTLKMFGNLSDVINRIINDMGEERGYIDYPQCTSRDGASRYEINVTNEDYLSMYNKYGPQSPRASLRRMIYYFVDNEIYSELGWEQINEYNDRDTEYLKRRLNDMETSANKIKLRLINLTDPMNEVLTLINNVREEYNL